MITCFLCYLFNYYILVFNDHQWRAPNSRCYNIATPIIKLVITFPLFDQHFTVLHPTILALSLLVLCSRNEGGEGIIEEEIR